jgi:coenzyme F420-0:L-glutamate ligase/coenzyme F420-1:gamma-L-glutamate ligase
LGLPEVRAGDDIAALVGTALRTREFQIQDGDIFVVAQKIVSKAEGRVVILAEITPSRRAREFADQWGKDARLIELVLRESRSILRMERGIIVSETSHGFVCANAGVDASNAPEGAAILLPQNPDRSAAILQINLHRISDRRIGVIVSDTFGRAWREGLVNVALGVARVPALIDYRGQCDGNGRPLTATMIASADEIASAAELVMGKSDRVPVAIVRGFTADAPAGTGRDLIRPAGRDLFR